MVQSGIRARFMPLKAIAFVTSSADWTAIGMPLEEPARLVKLQNLTNEAIEISTDGVDEHDLIPAQSFALYDLSTNQSVSGGCLEISAGTRFYARAFVDLPTEGIITLTAIYASSN